MERRSENKLDELNKIWVTGYVMPDSFIKTYEL